MCCLVYDHTLYDDKGVSTVQPNSADKNPFVSKKFAWLPSDFRVNDNGDVCLVSPYINNLQQSHKDLYSVIPTILGLFIPMFERVLGAIDKTNRPRTRGSFLVYWHSMGVYFQPGSPEDKALFPYIQKYHPSPGRMKYAGSGDVSCLWKSTSRREPYDSDEEARREDGYSGFPGDTRDERYAAWVLTQKMTLPEAHPTYQGALEADFRVASLRGRTIQVIVKLANIHLTPEKPKYAGGSWHVEGKHSAWIQRWCVP